ncbi:MAG: 50S ribosomal protein L9 [Lachnospiraceae bacterium]|nr:50S ribosomal protein L9 [Lachnospiraceae bacterium]
MKVILLQDVKGKGKKGDLIEVNDSYARNVLIAKRQGVEATGAAMNDLKLRTAHEEKVAEESLENAKKLAEDLKEKQVTLTMKSGKDGRTFGSVSTKEISEAVKSQLSLELDKKKMVLPEPIKALGTYEVSVKLHKNVTAVLRVKVEEEKD